MIDQSKSKERIRDLAEVYTAPREVNSMLNLIKNSSDNIESRFLEPSCGNGNFLVEILERKLKSVFRKYKKQEDVEFNIVKSVSSIYGVDINYENIQEAKERLHAIVIDYYSKNMNTKHPKIGFFDSIKYILEKNIICEDIINRYHLIEIHEFTSPKLYKITENIFNYADLLEEYNTSLFHISKQQYPMRNYWMLTENAS